MSTLVPHKLELRDYWSAIKNSHAVLLRRPLAFGSVATMLFLMFLMASAHAAVLAIIGIALPILMFVTAELTSKADNSEPIRWGGITNVLSNGLWYLWWYLGVMSIASGIALTVGVALSRALIPGWWEYFGVSADVSVPSFEDIPEKAIAMIVVLSVVFGFTFKYIDKFLLRTKKRLNRWEVFAATVDSDSVNLHKGAAMQAMLFGVAVLLQVYVGWPASVYLGLVFPAYTYFVYKATYDGSNELFPEKRTATVVVSTT